MKILLIDDHPIFRAGLELLLKELEPDTLVFHAGTCGEGIALAKKKALNLAFLDLKLPDGNGLECLRALKEARPSLPVVVISGEEVDREMIDRVLELKAMGFVPKTENSEMIVAALHTALAGGVFLPFSLVGKLGGSKCAVDSQNESLVIDEGRISRSTAPLRVEDLGITRRQIDVLRLVVQGLPNKRIASKLGISVPVVKKHVSDLLAHFHVLSRTHLVATMAQRGIVFGPPELSDPEEDAEGA